MIYENGLIGVNVFLLSQDYGHKGRKHYYRYVQNEQI